MENLSFGNFYLFHFAFILGKNKIFFTGFGWITHELWY